MKEIEQLLAKLKRDQNALYTEFSKDRNEGVTITWETKK